MVQNKKRIISLILMLTLLVSSLVIGAITASAAEESVTISFASTAQRVSQTSAAQVWKNGDVTFTNNKESSTSNVANYSNPVRLYAGSNIVIDAPGNITKIEFTCNGSYASALKSSIESGDKSATVTISGSNVTVVPSTDNTTYTIAKLTGQVRLNSLTVTYEEVSSCEHTNKVAIGEAIAATCTEDGITEGEKCDDCDKVIKAQETIPATGHKYGESTCSICGADKPSGYVPITSAESFVSGEYILVVSSGYAPTYYDNGWLLTDKPKIDTDIIYEGTGFLWTLTVNGNSVTIKDANGVFIAPKGGNDNGIKSGEYKWNWSVDNDGKFIFEGTGTDTVYLASNTIAAQGNNRFRGYKTTTVDGDTKNYLHKFTLYTCNHVYNNDCDTDCNVCGATRTAPHNYADATCTAPKTCACGATTGGVDASNHSGTAQALTSGGTADKHAVYSCCPNVTANANHSYNTEVTDPTCQAGGYTTYTCSCGYTYEADETGVDASNHSGTAQALTSGGTADKHAVYSCCPNVTANANHSYTSKVTAPTCTAGGYTTYTCSCGHSYVADETDALGHDMTGGKNQLPTCTEAGFKVNECTRCDYEEKTTVEALGHAWVDATCAAPKTCANCGATEGTVKNHAWGEIIVVTLPTCTEKGTNKVVCGDCGAVSHLPVAALGHATEVEYWAYNNKLYLVPVCGCLTEKELVDTTNALPVANEEDLEFLVTHGFNVFLDADINLTKTLDIEGAIVTIDLNGKTLKADWESDGVVEVIHVHDASHLTIVGDGNVISGGQYTAGTNSVISCRVYSMLTIKGGNYYSASYGDVIFCETSSIVRIEGGHFEAAKDYLGTWYILDIDETETYNRGQFVVTGGEFVKFDPANHTNDGSYTNKVVDGYHSINNNGIYTVGAHTYTSVVTAPTLYAKGYTTHTCVCGDYYIDTYVDAIPAEAQIGETKFETLQEALNAAVDGDVVVLLADIQVSKYLDVYTANNGATERKFTLDLNGKTISPAEGYNYNTGYPLVFVGINQTLTIKGEGRITADKKITVGVYGVLYLEGGNIVNNGNGEDDGAIHIYYWNNDLPSYEGIVGGTGYLNGGSVSGNIYCDDGDEKGEASLTVGNKFSKEPYALYKSADGSYVLISLMEAFKNAGKNDTIALAQDVVLPEKYLMLEATLDLAGHRLHVAGLFNNGRVVDTSDDLTGVLIVNDGGFTFDGIQYQDEKGNQLQVPVCVARRDGCNEFVFRTPKAQNKDAVETEGKVVIDFRPSFAGGGISNVNLFADGSLDNDVKFEIRVTRTGADGTKTVQLPVSQELVKKVYEVTNRGFRLNITGAEAEYTYTIELVIYSCGVTVHNTELAVIPAAPATGDDDEQVNA